MVSYCFTINIPHIIHHQQLTFREDLWRKRKRNSTDSDPPPLRSDCGPYNWTPYHNRIEFEVADFLYWRNQMSTGHIDFIFNLWAASLATHQDSPPFSNHTEMYHAINSTPLGDLPWRCFSLEYNGDVPRDGVWSWMDAEYDVWFRDPLDLMHKILSNPDFDGKIDYAPVQEYRSDGVHRYQNFMSGNWSWKQAVSISLVFPFIFLKFAGFNCGGPGNTWVYVYSYYPREWQDYRLGRYWAQPILASLHVHRQYT